MTPPGLSFHTRNLACGMSGLISWPGIKPRSPALGAQSLSYWATREVPASATFSVELMSVRGKKCCPHNIQSSDSVRNLCPSLTSYWLRFFLFIVFASLVQGWTCFLAVASIYVELWDQYRTVSWGECQGCSELLDQEGQLQSHGVQKERGWGLRTQHRKRGAVWGGGAEALGWLTRASSPV